MRMEQFNGITSDSREVKNGYLFAALSGTQFDGRDYMQQAVMNGATHILAQTGTQFPDNIIGIESDNPRHDFAIMASKFYNAQPDHIIAVTGTNGKTSTADFIRQICEFLELKSASLGTLGLISNHVEGHNVMTTPDPVKLHQLLADLKYADVNYLAMEASSHGLDQSRLDGLKPKVAAFTNLTQDHLDYHGDMETYFKAKSRLFTDILSQDGTAVVNADDAWAQKIESPNNIRFGMDKNSDICLLSQAPTPQGQDIQIQYESNIHTIHLNLIGLFQAYNIMCAAACCIALGLNQSDVFNCLPQLKGVAGRVELVASHDNCAAYIDYAHTPDALEKVLQSLRPHVAGRLICVFGAGGDRDQGKRPLMGQVVAQYSDLAIITDDNPRSENADNIRAQIQAAAPMADNIGDRGQAIKHAVSLLQNGDVLVITGKGHETGQTIGSETFPFSDFMVTQTAMQERFG